MEPIAIIGVAGRWAGVKNLSELSSLLFSSRTGKSSVPAHSYNISGFYHPDKDRPGSIPMKEGYFLPQDSREFDHAFFGINPSETKTLDPEQRQLLEVTYECLESAGITLEAIARSTTGVFVGNGGSDFPLGRYQDTDYGTAKPYAATGSAPTMTANRLSYVFDLTGPSVTVDTACSSSIYALHLACNSLLEGDCTAALVGGVSLILGPYSQIDVAKLGVLSPTSTCHTFDAAADGYARAEGCGMLLIKLLKDALRDKDPIRAVIRGTAANSNGKNRGITHPSSESQEKVIKEAYKRAGITDLNGTAFFECHATGTAVGDPVEVEAIGNVFRDSRTDDDPLLIGSVKSNLGHSEAACGIAHVLKAILMLESEMIPPTIGVTRLNPKIDFERHRVKVVTKKTSLKPRDGVLRISVNNSGFGGTNAHAVIESVGSFLTPSSLKQNGYEEPTRRQGFLLTFSAQTESSLSHNISRIKAVAGHHHIEDIAYTLGARRSHFHHRAFTTSLDTENIRYGTVQQRVPRICFVFTGQGAQWPRMGLALMNEFPAFLGSIRRLDGYLQQLKAPPDWSIEASIHEAETTSRVLSNASVGQTVCTALQISQVNLLKIWKIAAVASVGHSSGEIAAAYSAGKLTESQAIATAYYRGVVADAASSEGAMLAVGLGADEVAAYLRPGVTIGCVNSHRSVTLTGDRAAVEEAYEQLQGAKIFSRRLRTSGKAYHSEHMKQVGVQYQRLLDSEAQTCSTGEATTTMVSSVDGKVVEHEVPPSYWRRNLESPVLFDQAVSNTIHKFGITHLVEIGPHKALQGPLIQILQRLGARSAQYLSTLSRGEESCQSVLDLAGHLYLQGYPIALDILNSRVTSEATLEAHEPKAITDLPSYSWDHSKLLWSENRLSYDYRHRNYPRHELLGSKLPYGLMWRNVLRSKDVNWLDHHKKGDQTILPAAGYLVMAIEAISQSAGRKNGIYHLKEISFLSPLSLEEEGVETLFTMSASKVSAVERSKRWHEFSILSICSSGENWTEHCSGSIAFDILIPEILEKLPPVPEVSSAGTDMSSSYDLAAVYNETNYGPRFRLLSKVSWNQRQKELTAQAVLPPDDYIIHPATLDCGFQMTSFASVKGRIENLPPEVPVSVKSLTVISRAHSNQGCVAAIRSTAYEAGVRGIVGEWTLQLANRTYVACEGLRSVRYSRQYEKKESFPYYRLVWKPDIARLDSDSTKRTVKGEELGALLELYVHRDPATSILLVGGEEEETNKILHILSAGTPFERFKVLEVISENTKIAPAENIKLHRDVTKLQGPYDLIVLAKTSNLGLLGVQPPGELIAAGGYAIIPLAFSQQLQSEAIFEQLRTEDFALLHKTSRLKLENPVGSRHVTLLHSEGVSPLSPFSLRLESKLLSRNWKVTHQSLLSPITASKIISLVDLERPAPVLEDVDDASLSAIKTLIHASVIWVSNGDLLGAADPATGLMFGLTRTIVSEEPNLHFQLLDFDTIEGDKCISTICEHAEKFLIQRDTNSEAGSIRPEREFAVKNGIIYTSRYIPDVSENRRWNLSYNSGAYKPDSVSRPISNIAARMKLREIGQLDTLCFENTTQIPLGPDEVEFRVTAATINPKGVLTLLGIFEPELQKNDDRPYHSSFEHAGIVSRVGEKVNDIRPGDSVVSCWSGDYGTVERAPAWACARVEKETAKGVVTMPVAYMTALYAFEHLAKLKKDETVLIHSAAGPVGFAAIQIASRLGAKIYATVSSNKKREFLNQRFGIPNSRIFQSRDRSFVSDIKEATLNRGVDVILSAHTGDLLHDTWDCLAMFGRYVDIGRRDVLDHGKLGMNMFARHANFFSFDLGIIGIYKPELFRKLFEEVFELYRLGEIAPIEPITVFDVSQLSTAFRTYARQEHLGKVVIDYSNPRSLVPCVPPKPEELTFRGDACYLMVGGLGGLGQSLIKWMVARGARNFVLLSRSGNRNAGAPETLKAIQDANGTAIVVEGSIAEMKDCQKAIEAAKHPLKGVIHAAMVLRDGLFIRTTAEDFNVVCQPKHHGALNLHFALLHHDLDFFLIMSSVSAATGPLAQPNYAAANASLENLARLRHHLGLPAAAIALGPVEKVGVLGRHSELMGPLIRAGLKPLSEEGYLQAIELGLRLQHSDPYFMTGFDLAQLQEMYGKGQHRNLIWRRDPRFSLLVHAASNNQHTQHLEKQAAPRSLPDVTKRLVEMLGELLMKPTEQISPEKSAYAYGLDSLVGGELRLWMYQVFGVDVSFLEISDGSRSITKLAQMVLERRKKMEGKPENSEPGVNGVAGG